MRHPDPLTLALALSLSEPKIATLQKSLSNWMALDRNKLWSTGFNSSLVDVLGGLLEPDSDHLRDYLAHHCPKNLRALRARQIRYVALHWLADIALSHGDPRLE